MEDGRGIGREQHGMVLAMVLAMVMAMMMVMMMVPESRILACAPQVPVTSVSASSPNAWRRYIPLKLRRGRPE